MKYLSLNEHYPYIFNIIQQTLSFRSDPVPDYLAEESGLDDLVGILERVKMSYYKDFFEKASYLFTGLALGHYFSNGNKRLAITSLTYFAQINRYTARKVVRQTHKRQLHRFFPDIEFGRRIKNTTVFDNMLYDLTTYIASGKVTFRGVTPGVTEYLKTSLGKI